MKRAPRSKAATPARSIEWSARALRDLQEIDDFIAADNPVAAEKWVGKLIGAAEAAATAPLAGRAVPETERADIREVFVRTYRILYRVLPDRIVILTVFEGSMRFPSVDDG